MAFCKKCGAYIPIGETACPACGYDPEEEERQARAEQERREAEDRRKKEAAEAAEKERQEKERRAQQQKAWAEQERKREEERRRKEREARQGHGYSAGATQSQYASQGGAQTQYSSQQTGQGATQNRRTGWTPPWKETQSHGGSSYYTTYAKNKARAQDSAANQHLSVLSYLGPLFLIPLFTRPNDDFARFHANQGLNLLLLNGLLTVLGGSSGLIPFVGGIFSLYCTFKGIGNVLKGKKEPLPLIGKFHFLK